VNLDIFFTEKFQHIRRKPAAQIRRCGAGHCRCYKHRRVVHGAEQPTGDPRPADINSKISVSGDKASDEYLKEFTRYILSLALTYNPVNARRSSANCWLSMIQPSFRRHGKSCMSWRIKLKTPRRLAPFTSMPSTMTVRNAGWKLPAPRKPTWWTRRRRTL